MEGDVGHTGGLTNPRPWCGRCRAGYSNTGGPPLPRRGGHFKFCRCWRIVNHNGIELAFISITNKRCML